MSTREFKRARLEVLIKKTIIVLLDIACLILSGYMACYIVA